MNLSQIHDAISAVCPIDGVSVGRVDDRKIWSIQFKDEATEEQRNAAIAALNAFDAETPEVPDSLTRRQFFLQLEIAGLTKSVTDWVGTQGKLIQIAFKESGSFKRNEPAMVKGFGQLGYTKPMINQFFIEGSKL